MAATAFANPKNAYVTQGTFCYIPPRPFWYRLALAWIPRYLILCSILCIYITVFIYVRTAVYNFHRGSAMSYAIPSGGSPTMSTVNPMPGNSSRTRNLRTNPLHKLQLASVMDRVANISTPRERSRVAELQAARKQSQASDGASDHPEPAWERYSFGHLTPLPNVSPEEELEPIRPTDSQYPRRKPTIVEAIQDRRISWIAPFRPGVNTAPLDAQAPLDALTRPDFLDGNTFATSQRNAPDTVDMQDIENPHLLTRHKMIIRQIRFLLAYPLVYLLTWIIPFINHCRQYNDNYAVHPFFPLTCTTTTIVALQCAIDCWLFGYREKPWRQMESGSTTFWESFLFWKHWKASNGATVPVVERKTEAGVEPKNWWSQEEVFRINSVGTGSEDPMIEEDTGSTAPALRRDVGASTTGGQARMGTGGVDLGLVDRHSGTSVQ